MVLHYLPIFHWNPNFKRNFENKVMLDRCLTMFFQSFVLVRWRIIFMHVQKCNFGLETARKPVLLSALFRQCFVWTFHGNFIIGMFMETGFYKTDFMEWFSLVGLEPAKPHDWEPEENCFYCADRIQLLFVSEIKLFPVGLLKHSHFYGQLENVQNVDNQ